MPSYPTVILPKKRLMNTELNLTRGDAERKISLFTYLLHGFYYQKCFTLASEILVYSELYGIRLQFSMRRSGTKSSDKEFYRI